MSNSDCLALLIHLHLVLSFTAGAWAHAVKATNPANTAEVDNNFFNPFFIFFSTFILYFQLSLVIYTDFFVIDFLIIKLHVI